MINDISILHLASDNVFIDAAYGNFEAVAPACNILRSLME